MAVETIDISRFAVEAATSIADLKYNISELKKELNGLDIGSKDYKKTLEELENNQAALKNAMHGTATSMEQIAAAAKGQDESYNGLVRTMAKYKEELRAIDTSTAAGTEAFKKKAAQINEVNDKLKKLDAMQGNYQRNVGNYKSAVEGLGTAFRTMGGAAASTIAPVQTLTTSFKTLSATPVLGVLGLLAAAFNAVALGIKSDEENTNAWNRALAAFKPVGDSFMRTMQQVGEVAADLANKFVDLLDKWGLLSDASRQRMNIEESNQYLRKLQREINKENADLEETISDLRMKAAERDKYTAKERQAMLEEAKKWQMRIEENNSKMIEERLRIAKEEASLARNDAETNDKIAALEVQVIEQRVKRNTTLRRLNREISAAVKEQARTNKEAVNDIVAALEAEDIHEAEDFFVYDPDGAIREQNQQMFDDLIAQQDDYLEKEKLRLKWEQEAREAADEQEKERLKQKRELYLQYAGVVTSVLGSIADMYEADGEENEKSAKRAKGLRTAAAIIDTLAGAVAAYRSGVESGIPAPGNMILGAAQAAAAIAAGIAQVKKIQSTKVGSGGDTSTPAITTAPAYAPAISMTRSVTGRSEVERLNKMASDSRVYLVYSDLEIANTRQRVRVQETEF